MHELTSLLVLAVALDTLLPSPALACASGVSTVVAFAFASVAVVSSALGFSLAAVVGEGA